MIERLFEWLDKSTCNFLAVETITEELKKNNFIELRQNDNWTIKPGGKYFMVKNGSAVFAFTIGAGRKCFKDGVRIIAAHSDSPCFKIKPNPEIYGDGGVVSLNVEKYGGGIMYSWFDRPLSMSGRLTLRGKDAMHPENIIFDLKRPVATIPHLAIHFNREVNDGNKLSVQKDMKPVIGYFSDDEIRRAKANKGILLNILAKDNGVAVDDILNYEISLYPCFKAQRTGILGEYFQSGRIDDLSMAFAGLEALLSVKDESAEHLRMLAVFDNEETGSGTKQGAASPVLRDLLRRINECLGGSNEDFYVGIANSFMISADDAHAWNPNYNEKYDPTNHPVIGGGPVIKINSNCKYMTDSVGASIFKTLCENSGVRCQMFVNHSDVAGGSTLGNILTSQLDLKGVDVGAAIWAMHSAVETAGVSDHEDMVKVFTTFWKQED
ncbi:MAG: M18 family aminopeptidase [Muribaculaceae bacterium]|nr:M18 family aminopeptidase [Muribaculaceae bacterium]